MFTRLRPTIVACFASLLLASCRGQAGSEPASAITFTPHEVALLLGLSENSGVTFGDITSDKGGVKVASIRWEDKTGRQLDVRDVDLAIASTSRLVYAISSLKIAELDLLDLKSGQRAQASNLTVAKPGERFLAALEDAIATAESGGVLKTSGLTFSRLAVDRLDYLVRNDNEVTKVTLERLALDDATSDTLGTFAIGRITVGETGTLENLQLTKVDRQWTDDVVNALLSLAPHGPALPRQTAGPTQPIIPLEKLTVDRLKLELPAPGHADLALIDLNLVVDRDANGAMQAIRLSAEVAIPLDLLTEDPLSAVREYLESTSSHVLYFAVRAEARYDANLIEHFTNVELAAPSVGNISGTMRSQNMASLLNMLLYNARLEELAGPMISHVHVDYRDDGLIAYLLSNRYPQSKDANEFLTGIAENFPIASERTRLYREIERFRRAPGSIVLDVAASRFLTLGEFDRRETVENGDLRVTLKFAER